jgi:O-antigen ligase
VKFKNQTVIITLILILSLSGAISLMDESFLNRVQGIFSTEQNAEEENAATRTFFWIASIDMAKDFPLGTGINGFIYYSPIYIPEDVATGPGRNRAVHSTWFEALSEIGYLGLISLIAMVFLSYRSLTKCRQRMGVKINPHDYYRLIAIQSALIAFVVTMTFLNRLRADIFYWCILYTACAYSIYRTNNVIDGSSGKKFDREK